MSFVLLQLAEILFLAFVLVPDALRLLFAVLIAGFPIVVSFSWVYDITRGGLSHTDDLDEEARSSEGRRGTSVRRAVASGADCVPPPRGRGPLAGLVAAVSVGSIVRGPLHGLPAYDPLSLLAVATVMVVTGVGATWTPVLEALRVGPAELLREE